MNLWIGVTDGVWYRHLRSIPDLDEVNFWQPSGGRAFRVLEPGEPFLFKLHSPDDFIVGGGFFLHHTPMQVSVAWEAFGEKNGAASYAEMRRRIAKYRRDRSGVPASRTLRSVIRYSSRPRKGST